MWTKTCWSSAGSLLIVASASATHLPSFRDVVMRMPRSGVAFRLMRTLLSSAERFLTHWPLMP